MGSCLHRPHPLPAPRAHWLATLWLGGFTLAAAAAATDSLPPSEAAIREPDAVAQVSPEELSEFALPTTRDRIGRVVVAATVNGKGPFRFIVDTGATHSTVSPGLVRALDLKMTEAPVIVVNGITGTAQVTAVTLDKLQTGDLVVAGLVAPVVWAPVMAGADGIFGAAGLTEKSLSVDFDRNSVRISGRVEPTLRAQATKVHAARVTHGLMTLEMRIGGVRALAVIDTGSERTLGNLALRDALKVRRDNPGQAMVTSVYGATEQVERGEVLEAPPLVIDTVRINDVSVVYGDFHIFKVWEMQSTPALILGMDVLGTVGAFGIDFKNQDVYFTNSHPVQRTIATPGGSMGNTMQHR
jgi:predicted aspartyl protease